MTPRKYKKFNHLYFTPDLLSQLSLTKIWEVVTSFTPLLPTPMNSLFGTRSRREFNMVHIVSSNYMTSSQYFKSHKVRMASVL